MSTPIIAPSRRVTLPPPSPSPPPRVHWPTINPCCFVSVRDKHGVGTGAGYRGGMHMGLGGEQKREAGWDAWQGECPARGHRAGTRRSPSWRAIAELESRTSKPRESPGLLWGAFRKGSASYLGSELVASYLGSVFGVRASLAISKASFRVLYRFPTAGTGGLDSSNRLPYTTSTRIALGIPSAKVEPSWDRIPGLKIEMPCQR